PEVSPGEAAGAVRAPQDAGRGHPQSALVSRLPWRRHPEEAPRGRRDSPGRGPPSRPRGGSPGGGRRGDAGGSSARRRTLTVPPPEDRVPLPPARSARGDAPFRPSTVSAHH